MIKPGSRRLYLSVLSTFAVFAVAFIVFQQHREKEYKIETLNMKLQDYNAHLHESVADYTEASVANYVSRHRRSNLRVTIIRTDGSVAFDNVRKDYDRLGNHRERKEVASALTAGTGYAINRLSASVNKDYFYSATFFKDDSIVVRSALPYDVDLAKQLQADQHYLWFALAVMLLLAVILYPFARQLDTDFKALYERLQHTKHEQEQLKRQLTQNIAHELKTPVAGIRGYIETLMEHPDIDEHTRKRFLERSHAQTERLTALIQDISTLHRMDDAPHEKDFRRCDISRIAETVMSDAALRLYERRMTFENNLVGDILVDGDPSLLHSIFANLTDNAIAYAGEGTRITLTMAETEREWLFTFSDNGQGVGEEHLPHLFERFYRVDKGRSRRMGGTGLGLAIVKNAVLLHGGRIGVRNNPDGGLRFDWTLPKAATSAPEERDGR